MTLRTAGNYTTYPSRMTHARHDLLSTALDGDSLDDAGLETYLDCLTSQREEKTASTRLAYERDPRRSAPDTY